MSDNAIVSIKNAKYRAFVSKLASSFKNRTRKCGISTQIYVYCVYGPCNVYQFWIRYAVKYTVFRVNTLHGFSPTPQSDTRELRKKYKFDLDPPRLVNYRLSAAFRIKTIIRSRCALASDDRRSDEA